MIICWGIPWNILQNKNYNKIVIFQGTNENDINSYHVHSTIDRWRNGDLEKEVISYNITDDNSNFYFIKYQINSDESTRTDLILTTTELTPKEKRLVKDLKFMLDPIIAANISEDGTFEAFNETDFMYGINFSLNYFNIYPPQTYFIMSNLPKNIEPMILLYARYFVLLIKATGIKFRDFSYSDNGLSLNQSFGAAIDSAIQQTLEAINATLKQVKMDIAVAELSDAVGSLNFATGPRLTMYPSGLFSLFGPIVNPG